MCIDLISLVGYQCHLPRSCVSIVSLPFQVLQLAIQTRAGLLQVGTVLICSFLPEFSECELNRVGTSSPYTDDDGQLESEYLVGIDSCQPSNPAASGVTKCCSTSSECAGFGEECCDQVRLQCVPTLGSEDIISLLQCL